MQFSHFVKSLFFPTRPKAKTAWHSLSSHSKLKPFACENCNFRTAYPMNLKRHRAGVCKGHQKEKPFSCGRCDYSTELGKNLRRHERRCKEVGKRPQQRPESRQ